MSRARALLRHWPWAWLFLWLALALGALSTTPEHELARTLLKPGAAEPFWLHPLGCDAFGRDLLLIVMRASAQSAAFAAFAVALSCALGIAAGTGIALAAPRPRYFLLRALDLLLAFPSILFAFGWAAVRGPGWDTLTLSLAIGILPPFTRLIYARTRELLSEEYVLAGRALGATPAQLAWNHLTPSLLSLCAVKAPGLFAGALIAEATLSFVGIGAPIGHDTWGLLLVQAKDYLLEAPHIALGAGLPLVLTVLALQLISERFSEKHFRIP
jgi:peptide/nickel transport system permease protein